MNKALERLADAILERRRTPPADEMDGRTQPSPSPSRRRRTGNDRVRRTWLGGSGSDSVIARFEATIPDSAFVDDDDSLFQGAIERLGTAGVTQGCNPPDNDRFCPNDPVTRGQMAAFLARAFGLP